MSFVDMKTVLIAGAGTGIGRTLAQTLREQGIHVITRQADPGLSETLPEKPLHGLIYCPPPREGGDKSHEDLMHELFLEQLAAIRVIVPCLSSLNITHNSSVILFTTLPAATSENYAARVEALEMLMIKLSVDLGPVIRVNAIAIVPVNPGQEASAVVGNQGLVSGIFDEQFMRQSYDSGNIIAKVSLLLSGSGSPVTGQVFIYEVSEDQYA